MTTDLAPLEIRVATVMTGGVSLAVWMGGVGAELDALRRGEGAYGRLLAALNCTVEFDIFVGTSAGGINAAAGALAAATGGSTRGLRDVWIGTANLQHLLRDPLQRNPPSLMYGDGVLLKGLRSGLATVVGPGSPPVAEDYPKLAITTTLLRGEASCFRDDAGTLVQDRDHRGLFTFDRLDLVDSGAAGVLAVAARSSASFPAAFEASLLPVGEAADGRPDLEPYLNATTTGWAVDGGVLVNRPLGPALRWVFQRPAAGMVRRVLAYVVPSSAEATAPPTTVGPAPGMAPTLAGTVGALTSQSIGAELGRIREHNDRVVAQRNARGHLATMLAGTPDDGSLWRDAVALVAETQAQDLLSEVDRWIMRWDAAHRLPPAWHAELDRLPSGPRGWHAAALAGRMRALDLVPPPQSRADLVHLGLDPLVRAAAVAIALLNAAMPGQYEAMAQAKGRVHAAVTVARQQAASGAGAASLEDLVRAGLAFTEAETVVDWIGGLARRWPHPAVQDHAGFAVALTAAWDVLAEAVGQMSLPDGAPMQPVLDLLRGATDPAVALARLVVTELVMNPQRPEFDQRVELLQMSADTRTHPSVDPRVRAFATDKLTGLQLHHFGAFYRSSWRANDWMWGRIDGAGWVVYLLLQPERVRSLGADPDAVIGVVAELTGADVAAAGERVRAEVRGLLEADPADLPAGLPELATWAASAIQREAAAQELPVVALQAEGAKDEPATSASKLFRATAATVFAVPNPPADKVAEALGACQIAAETIQDDARSGSPFFVRTAAKALATGSAAAQGIAGEKPPSLLRPVLPVVRGATATTYVVGMGAKTLPQLLGWVVGAGGLAVLTGGWTGLGGVVHVAAVVALGLLLLAFLYVGLRASGARGFALALGAVLGVLLLYIAVAPFIPQDWTINGYPVRAGPFTVLAKLVDWLAAHPLAWLLLVLAAFGGALGLVARARRARVPV
jgi:patatin-related protein